MEQRLTIRGDHLGIVSDRLQRRSGLPIESRFVFYPRRLWEVISTQARFAAYFWRLQRLVWKVKRRDGEGG